MKVLLLNGSPKARGNTAYALSQMAEVFAAEGVETEILHVGNQPIRGQPGLLCFRKCYAGGVSGSAVLQHRL